MCNYKQEHGPVVLSMYVVVSNQNFIANRYKQRIVEKKNKKEKKKQNKKKKKKKHDTIYIFFTAQVCLNLVSNSRFPFIILLQLCFPSISYIFHYFLILSLN